MTTEQMIEKYKSEMQQMIVGLKKPPALSDEREETDANIVDNNSIVETQPVNEGTEQVTPPLTSIEDFPSFAADREKLNRRIEEILSQNSDVAREEDMPQNINIKPNDSIPSEFNSEQGDLILSSDDIIIDTPQEASNAQTERPKISAPMYSPEPKPVRLSLSRPEIEVMPQQREVSFEDMAPPLSANEQQEQTQNETQNEQDETPGQIVSRVCIRGGAKAQYSPPANTGLALGTNFQAVPPLSDTGTLRVEVFTANRAIPIKNAMIRVRNADNNQLVAVLTTDGSGDTSIFELPTPSRELSLQSGSVHPFVNYLVDIRADGYIPKSDLPVQMFGGIESLLPANMIPLNT